MKKIILAGLVLFAILLAGCTSSTGEALSPAENLPANSWGADWGGGVYKATPDQPAETEKSDGWYSIKVPS